MQTNLKEAETIAIAPTSAQLLKIGQVATQSDFSVKTIRYYEEQGLLIPVVTRSPTGYRLFKPAIFNRLGFIKRAQSLGLSLNEIGEILILRDRGELPCGMVRKRLLLKQKTIHEQIEALEILQSELQDILSGWQEKPDRDSFDRTICPNIET
ncbi:heavy metal-responsive transcriptional regulator [Spirulina sp. 06S082]|uniref:heavy metal-responsive transcriptional regulator n=1 Tax=Spirulina sp. 06S082 TaxID=3110248 RepID=UPI002B20F0ED|nr:heavy metal-responsive transcriptional regulator [Spirulina sp. 06S082]MEA5468856.1 heavy metal-responsive transcriptional regulator [Spirulina sp. 06S082]